MSRGNTQYQVFPHDGLLRFRVLSATRGDVEHVVDIGAHQGNGECSCEHFQFRLLPAIESNLAHRGHATRCSHIMAAREACTNRFIQRAIEIEARQSKDDE
jgi:hypothetical protein